MRQINIDKRKEILMSALGPEDYLKFVERENEERKRYNKN